MRNKPLTAAFVKNVRTPGRYGDGHGGHGLTLDVKVSRNGRIAKSWIQRIRMNGKPTHMGLGAWPVISLATARDKAIENARTLTLGRDPRDGTTQIPTFAKGRRDRHRHSCRGLEGRRQVRKPVAIVPARLRPTVRSAING